MKARKILKVIGCVVGVLIVLGVAYLIYWLQPMPAAQEAVEACQRDSQVDVSISDTAIAFIPKQPIDTGLIFYPGAKVDPRAYAIYMRTFAEQGYPAFIVKMPLNLAFLGVGQASGIIKEHPEIKNWVIGGHSLGGTFASVFAAEHASQIRGLLLYASYPASDIRKQLAQMPVLSISGSNDGLATPAKVENARTFLPDHTRYIVVKGGIHSYFGDYGLQKGDGQASISRSQANEQISSASLEFLRAISKPEKGN
ncbi:alpha/beta family hydrolase [Ktedonosporobacter rubrisoli]|nr:alpha/beta family hydrolase [Ktedonosporobacter rubrisoli]